jgi:hypothetical protein
VNLEPPIGCGGASLVPLPHALDKRVGVQQLPPDRELAAVAPGEHQQILGELRQTLGFLRGGSKRARQLRGCALAAKSELELGAESG